VPGIDLNHAVLPVIGIQRVLNVTFTHDAEVANDLSHLVNMGECRDCSQPYLKGGTPQHMILVVGQCLRGCDDNRISCMRAKRVEVFHVTAYNRVLNRKESDS
jgi:hypothetical protein